MKKVNIITPENEEELPVDILVEHIIKLADVGGQLVNSRLKMRTIIVLLKDMTGLPFGDIKRVLEALPNLEREYLK